MRFFLQRVNLFAALTCKSLLVLSLAVAVSLLNLSSARAADNIGDKLPSQAVRVLKELKKSGYKNVGVLNFRVQNGDAPESFNVGPLNIIAARSLENALILQNGEVKPEIGIIREAGAVAARQNEKVSYLKADGRDKLFTYKYPLAWGNQKVEADAFVTGLVKINPNMKETTVVIEVFDGKEKKLREVTRFKVPMERTILADICQSFALAPDKVRKAGGGSFDEPDALAEAVNPKAADKAGIVELKILYNNQVQKTSAHPTRPEAEKVNTPQVNQPVVLVLHNRSKDYKAGVVLAVSGRNTLYNEDILQRPRESLSRWILGPGETMQIRGITVKRDGKDKLQPFTVLSDADSEKAEELDPNPNLGAITLIVFTEGNGSKPVTKDPIGLRASSPFGETKPKTADEASKMAGKTFKQPLRSANIFVPDPGKEVPIALKDDKLRDPQFQAERVIWFHERTK